MSNTFDWPESSPMWRFGLYKCEKTSLLQIGDDNGADRQAKIDVCVNQAGLSLVKSGIKPKPPPDSHADEYSDDPSHGYTYHASIGKSGILVHSYPEVGTFTAAVETCADEEESEQAVIVFRDLLIELLGAKGHITNQPDHLPLTYPEEEQQELDPAA